MAVSTKTPVKSAAPSGDDFIKSMLEPGNHKVKLLAIFLQPGQKAEFGDRLVLKLETEPIGGVFKGLPIDKNDLTKGYHVGRVGYVAYSRFSFRDWVSPMGFEVFKETELQVAIQDLCEGLKINQWYLDQDEKAHADMTAFIKAFDEEKPFKDIYFHVCIAGKEYVAQQGKYVNNEMFFPAEHRQMGKAYSLNPEKVQKFFESSHMERLKEKPTNSTVTEGEGKATPTQTEEKKTDGPVHSKPTSQAEIDFMNEGKNKTTESPFTAEPEEQVESNTDIITGNDGDKFPWEK